MPSPSPHDVDDRDRWCCFGCGAATGRANGISMSGDINNADTRYELCYECFDKLPVPYRVAMNMLLRSRGQGGLGVVEALERLTQMLEASATEIGQSNILDILHGGKGSEN